MKGEDVALALQLVAATERYAWVLSQEDAVRVYVALRAAAVTYRKALEPFSIPE